VTTGLDDRRLVKTSKYLSKHLRHQPERLGLTLQSGGWVGVDELLQACAAHGFALSLDDLHEVVERNDKRRLSFDGAGVRIRANQGHSVDVDLELAAAAPPKLLFHGTGAGNVDAIMRDGLQRRGRHHVHLSPDRETARRVGARHGRPVVFDVDAARMHADGHTFFVSDNGVWLIDEVPPAYLTTREPV
jgi:putative RNA 2'-phosphotransferase